MDYKSAGVDVDKGDELVDWIQNTQVKGPFEDKLISGVGGFASIMRFDFPEYKEPCLVSATDGVGTKLRLAVLLEKYDTIGQDLVAMCVNDLACCGARPLFFLDYYATGKLDLKQAQPFLEGVRKACHEVGAQLVGGETAEMPGIYSHRDFDCAGFAVGVVDKPKILGPHKVQAGDVVLGVSSSGFHSNGYSLLRKVFEKDMEEWAPKLLTPTHLYTKLVNDLTTIDVHAVAHITGGGMENIPRVIPKGMGLKLQNWEWPEIFREVQKRAAIDNRKMLETFNCGMGLTVILPAAQKDAAKKMITKHNYKVFELGSIEKSDVPLTYPE